MTPRETAAPPNSRRPDGGSGCLPAARRGTARRRRARQLPRARPGRADNALRSPGVQLPQRLRPRHDSLEPPLRIASPHPVCGRRGARCARRGAEWTNNRNWNTTTGTPEQNKNNDPCDPNKRWFGVGYQDPCLQYHDDILGSGPVRHPDADRRPRPSHARRVRRQSHELHASSNRRPTT